MTRLTHTLLFYFCLSATLSASVFDLELGGDFLLWQECSDDLDFAFQNGQYQSLSPDLTPGGRVYASFPELCIQGSCEYIKSCRSNFIESDNADILSTLGHAALLNSGFTSASGKYTTEYYGWDAMLCYPCDYECGNFIFSPSFGVAGLYLTQELSTVFSSLSTAWESALWAAGLKCGADYVYKITERFFIYGQTSGMILGGEGRRGHNLQVINDATYYRFDDEDRCYLIPGLRTSLGLSFDVACCTTPMGFHVGWELVRYYNIPNARVFMGDQLNTQALLSTSPSVRTFGYQGLVVGADILF